MRYEAIESPVPACWKRVSIGQICDLKNGYAFKPSDWSQQGLPIVRIQNLNNPDAIFNHYSGELRERFIINTGDLLFAWSGTPGTSFGAHIWKGGKAALNQHIFRVDFDETVIHKKFFMFAINQKLSELIERAHGGVGLRHVTKGKFEATQIDIPDYETQEIIVTKIETLFSELDKGIESLKTARKQLKAYRQAVLKHAFEGKLTEQWRQQNPDKLKSPMPEIRESQGMVVPESWSVCYVQDVLVLGPSNGRSVKDREGGFPVLRLTALKNGRIDVSEYKNGNWCREEAEPHIVREGDFLLSRGNGSKHLVGRGGLVREHTFEVAFPDTMVRLRVDQDLVHPDYFSLLWESRVIRQQIEASARTTAGIYKINQGHIKAFSVPIPGIDEQKEIVDRLHKTLSVVDKQESELIDALVSSKMLRQSILKRAFSGQLSIKIGG